ncbi:MAG: hypothetical protein B5M52_05150 [Helicobacteraceae bacterium 4484_230]|nr:MAG: hypothetical protein B5M52_05150 [Helicobacteraceae bacterium 4484_230]
MSNNLQIDLSGIVSAAIDDKLKDLNIEEQIKDIIGDIAKNSSKIITVKLDGKEDKKFPLVHKQFEDLLQVAAIGENILLTGGAGLSKSTAVEQVARALDLELIPMSFSNQTTKTDLFGFVDANGIERVSGFVDAFINGKMFLGDEMDACSANVFILLNSALENGFLLRPNGEVVYAHENFRFIGTANTNLRGSKDGFTARNKMDAATIDRFVVIEWQLDEDLEEKITDNNGWLRIVRKARTVAETMLDNVVITPRPAYKGAKLLKAGVDIDKIIEMTLIKGLSTDERDILLKNITAADKKRAIKDAGIKEEPEEEYYETDYEEITENDTQDRTPDKEEDFGEW